MELIYSFGPIAFYLKLAFIISLFIINLYLIFTYNPNLKNNELQSGLGNKNLKSILSALGILGGALSSYITIKNEIKDYQIGKLNQLQVEVREEIRRSIDKDRTEHQRILTSINSNREELFKLYNERAKVTGHTGRLLDLHGRIKDNVLSYKDKSTDLNSKLSELGIIDQLISRDVNRFSEEASSLLSNIESPSVNDSLATVDKEIKDSFVLGTDIFQIKDWFDGLIGVKKLAFTIVLGKSVILSSLVSIIFIFYGNILIEKYDLVNRYPKLAKFIELRKKYQKYYFRFYCMLILFVVLVETILGLAILFL